MSLCIDCQSFDLGCEVCKANKRIEELDKSLGEVQTRLYTKKDQLKEANQKIKQMKEVHDIATNAAVIIIQEFKKQAKEIKHELDEHEGIQKELDDFTTKVDKVFYDKNAELKQLKQQRD